jgi:hypothetical protein
VVVIYGIFASLRMTFSTKAGFEIVSKERWLEKAEHAPPPAGWHFP